MKDRPAVLGGLVDFPVMAIKATVLALAAFPILLAACRSAAPAPDVPAAPRKEPSLLGPTTREAVEAAEPDWVAEEVAAAPDLEAARGLAEVPPGAEVAVYFGTWCGDSRRELARLWRALDEIGGEVPFALDYLAVDRRDRRPPELERDLDLRWVPTFVVRREGREVGRIVEISPHGVERDLLALLTGSASGVLSGREDLGGTGHPAP